MFACVKVLRLRALLVAGLITITSFVAGGLANAQAGAKDQWTWMGGSSTQPMPARNTPGVYGTLGTPAAGNYPGSRLNAATWTTKSGKLWLFGGFGYTTYGSFAYLNDLWEFDPSTNLWTWVGGSDTVDAPGVYGTLGTPAAGNIPGARGGSVTWTDAKGNLWLFGGSFSSNGYEMWFNDLWEYNPSTNQWAWMAGSSTLTDDGLAGIYGTLGTPAAGNNPGSRESGASWTDSKGNLWLFGGIGYDAAYDYNWLNDLWEFNPSIGEWAWMGGTSVIACNTPEGCVQGGTYGTQGTPAAGNIPGGRYGASTWTDGSGNLWLFGGSGIDSTYNLGELNDLWKFNPATNEWAWISGSSTLPGWYTGAPGVYGTLGTPAEGNVPAGRNYAASWMDGSGNLWLFGGIGGAFLNDLWEFSPASNQWTWMGGDNPAVAGYVGWYGIYGTLGTPAESNVPGIRYGAASWTDSGGNFWLYAGEGYDNDDPEGLLLCLNDLWRYQPAAANFQQAPAPTFSVAPGTYGSTQAVTLNDALPGANIYYTTDGRTPTTDSTIYTDPITVSLYSTTETVNAIAGAPNYFDSAVASATYVIDLPASPATVTMLSSSVNPSSVGQPVTFTATVFPVSASTTPAGTVQFTVDGVSAGLPVALNGSGVASYTTSALTAGGGDVTATYIPASGSPFTASTSATLDQAVEGPCAGISATTLTSSLNPSGTGQPVTFNVSVTRVAAPACVLGGGTGGTTTFPYSLAGTVQFTLNGVSMGSPVEVSSSGAASYTASLLPAGNDSMVATYTEDNGFVGSSVSSPLVQVVGATAASPGFALAPAAAMIAMQPGGSIAVNIAINPLGGFNGNVTLSADQMPNGVTASFGPNPASSTSVLTLAADSMVAPGIYSFEVNGSSGSLTAQAPVQFAIDTAGYAAPTFGATSSIVSAGSTASYPVTLPSSLASASATCLNLPAGAACSLSGNTLIVATSTATPAGTYQITVVFMGPSGAAVSAGVLLPLVLLPLARIRRSPTGKGRIISKAGLALILLVAAMAGTGCSGGLSATAGAHQQVVESGGVSLTVQ
jgi:N-acetylneuraminic acid mutarotase